MYKRQAIKKVDAAVAAGDKAAAQACLTSAITEIDKACSKGVYHPNNAVYPIILARMQSDHSLLAGKTGCSVPARRELPLALLCICLLYTSRCV